MPLEHQRALPWAPDAPNGDAGSGGGLQRVAAAARRRAARAGDHEVDTGHLLHALLESDAEALSAAAPERQRAARLMGYLAQRSIGFGLGWQSAAEQGAAAGYAPDPGPDPGSPRWSGAAAAALQRAAARGQARGLDLLAELTADAGCRAAQILAAAGADPALVALRCAAARPLRARTS